MFEDLFQNMNLSEAELYRRAKAIIYNPIKVTAMESTDIAKLSEVVADYDQNGKLSERSKMICNVDMANWIAGADEVF